MVNFRVLQITLQLRYFIVDYILQSSVETRFGGVVDLNCKFAAKYICKVIVKVCQ